MYLEFRMSIYFGQFRECVTGFSGGRNDRSVKAGKKRRPGISPRPLKRILKGFPVTRYYLRRTIFFMFS
jgi:hypothetical protein